MKEEYPEPLKASISFCRPIIYPSKPAAAPVSASCWWLAARLDCFWFASGPRQQGWRQLDMVTWLQHKPRIGSWENHGKSAFSPHLQALHPSLLLCALARFHWKRLLVCLNGFVWPKSNSLSYFLLFKWKHLFDRHILRGMWVPILIFWTSLNFSRCQLGYRRVFCWKLQPFVHEVGRRY